MRRAAVGVGLVMLVTAGDVVPVYAQIRGGLTFRPPAAPAALRAPISAPLPVLPLWWQWPVVMLPEIAPSPSPRVLDGAPTGGVQLDVVPWSADVYVDGVRAGRVEDFRGYYRHLELPAGPHVIAIVKPGAEPLVANIVIVPGRTLTYRGSLR
jgi:hypothetical protein